MVPAQHLRSSLSLLTAGILAACGASLPRSVTLPEGSPATITLVSKNGPTLSLQNESSLAAAEAYSGGNDTMRKVVPDAEMQALLDVFTAEQVWADAGSRAPDDARDVVHLQVAGNSWYWARRGSFTSPAESAFHKVRSYFVALYNSSTAFHTDRGRRTFDRATPLPSRGNK